MWMGNWNPTRDREPDKKEEQLFKQFLISKYERKQWYKSPAEVKKEEPAAPEAKVEAKIQPPPSSKVRKLELFSILAFGHRVWEQLSLCGYYNRQNQHYLWL